MDNDDSISILEIKLLVSLLGTLVVPVAAEYAYIDRGYFAIGGEYMIPIMLFALCSVVDAGYKFCKSMLSVKNTKH